MRLFALLVSLLVVKERNRFFNGAVCLVISWETAAAAVHFLGHNLGPVVGHFGLLQ